MVFCCSTLCRDYNSAQSRFTVYDPANGVPKRPTASSIQMRRSATRIAAQRMILWLVSFTFLITTSQIRLVPNNRTPVTTKSARFQFTSFVNCIDINGISSKKTTMRTMPISLLFSLIIIFSFIYWFGCLQSESEAFNHLRYK